MEHEPRHTTHTSCVVIGETLDPKTTAPERHATRTGIALMRKKMVLVLKTLRCSNLQEINVRSAANLLPSHPEGLGLIIESTEQCFLALQIVLLVGFSNQFTSYNLTSLMWRSSNRTLLWTARAASEAELIRKKINLKPKT